MTSPIGSGLGLRRVLNAGLKRLGVQLVALRPHDDRAHLISLAPSQTPAGRVLLAYVIDPFLEQNRDNIGTGHTHHHESLLIAQAWLQRGYHVDVIDYRNSGFAPAATYDYFVSARTNLAAVAPRLNAECVKIAHLDTSHFAANNAASYRRLEDLQRRRGISLPRSMRIVEVNQGIEAADYGVVLGNEVTCATYEYCGKPLFRLDVPAVGDPPAPKSDSVSARSNRFLWLGSNGLLHKGLDLVLEAFAGMPEMNLTVCGPIDDEPEFVAAYDCEWRSRNIEAVGWVDVTSATFAALAERTLGIVYPSCAEGQAGSVVNCVRAGLIPIVSRESGLTVNGFGEVLPSCNVSAIRDTVRRVAGRPESELEAQCRATWEHGRSHHSHERYVEAYGSIIADIIADSPRRH